MLTAEGCRERRQALSAQFGDFDLLLVSQPQHIFYLSGFLIQAVDFSGWGQHFLLLDRDGGARLLVDNWVEGAAHAAHVDQVEVWTWYDFVHSAPEKYTAAADALASSLARHYSGLERVAVDRPHLPLAAREALGAVRTGDLTPALTAMRQVKHADELACIRRALRATEAGQAAARRAIRPGISEMEVFAEVYASISLDAGGPILLLGDFAGGERAAAGGGPPTGNVLREGELMILDMIPLVAGYWADITNTLCAGEPDQTQRERLGVLEEAMRSAEAALRPGTTGAEVYQACRAPLARAGLAEAFPHHAGHAIGLGNPEPPYLAPASHDRLQVGNVVTLEPGIYLPGWGGIRIEHNYLITALGFERLSQHVIGL